MQAFLGIDGGGTSCRAVAVDETGAVLFSGQGGAANLASTPGDVLKRSLAKCLAAAPPVEGIIGCFAGQVSAETAHRAKAIIGSILPGPPIEIRPDYYAALKASAPETTVCAIAGTGSIVCSWRDGEGVKTGGDGALLGDEFSGFQFGRAALRQLRRNPPTAAMAKELARRKFGNKIGDLIPRIYSSPSPPAQIASFAPVFFADLAADEDYARNELERQAAEFAQIISHHRAIYHPGIEQPIISLAGSVFKRATARHALEDALWKANALGWKVVQLAVPPVMGAAQLAREEYGNQTQR